MLSKDAMNDYEINAMRERAAAADKEFPSMRVAPWRVIWLIDRVRELEAALRDAIYAMEEMSPNGAHEEYINRARTALGKEEG